MTVSSARLASVEQASSGLAPRPGTNLLYNGAMNIAQRATSAAGITTSGYYTLDRWQVFNNAAGTWTMTQESDGPAGFKNSLKMECTSGNTPGTTDYLQIRQDLEGRDLQAIRKGTAEALPLTLSFWVKSNKTGTYIAELRDVDNGTYASRAYTIDSAGVWEHKTVTVPADTTGTLDDDSSSSFGVQFWLYAGSYYSSGTLQSGWFTSQNDRAPGQVDLGDAVSNYWQVTGVQLEVGPVATDFQHLSYGDEIIRCERYYQRLQFFSAFGEGTTRMWSCWPFRTEMRTETTTLVKLVGETIYYRSAGASDQSFTVSSTSGAAGENCYYTVGMNGVTGLTDGHPYVPRGYDGGTYPMELDDEL